MSDKILMPKSTAIWLIDNTALTFSQIAEFCGLHILEIQSLADGEINENVTGQSPIVNRQLTREEILRCEQDNKAHLNAKDLPAILKKKTKSKKYTPLSKRQDKPDAIQFLLKKHPSLNDAQISKLIGTTKTTIGAIRDKTHWKMSTMKNIDPVISGFCSQTELENAVKKAEKRLAKEGKSIPQGTSIEQQTLADTDKFLNL